MRRKRYLSPYPSYSNPSGAPAEKHTASFDSMGNYLAWLHDTPVTPGNFDHSNTSTSYFSGTENYQEAVDLGYSGWLEGQEKATAISTPIVETIAARIERLDVVHDVEGAGIDVARYTDGEPECWQRWQSSIVEGKGNRVLKLVFNYAVSAGISTEVIMAKGAAIAALVQALEYGGFRMEVVVSMGLSSPGKTSESYIRIKDASQDLNMPRLMFTLAHPAMLRRLGFAYIERLPKPFVEALGSSYGWPAEVSSTGDIYVGKSFLGEPQWTDPKSVSEWIVSELKKQGITLREGN